MRALIEMATGDDVLSRAIQAVTREQEQVEAGEAEPAISAFNSALRGPVESESQSPID